MATAGSSSSNSNSEMVPNRIFVGGIPLDASLSEFEQCIHNVSDPTHIIDINIVNDQQGQSKGFGFVTFDSQVSAARMLAQSKDLTIRDSKLNVAHAFKRLKPYTTRLQPVRIQTDFGAYQFGGGERREYRNGSFKSPNNYQKPVTPAPSSSDDSSTPATHTTTETDVWHSSVSSITKDAPTAMSESSSIGAALCCVVDGNEATNQPTTDRNNNHTLVDKDVGLPIPVHNKDKTADSSSSLASSAPTRFIVPNTQQQQHNNTFTQRKHPGSRNYKYTNGAQINGGRYRSNTFNLHGEQYGNSSNKQQQQELVYHISPRGGNNGGANGNKASYYHQYNNLIQQQYQQQFAMLAAAQQQQQPQTESAKQQPAPIPKEPTVVLAANVNNLTGSARSRVERSRYNGPTSPAAHAAMQISHAASINSAQTFTPPPAPTTNTSNTPPIATNTTHNLAPIHMTYQPQQPSQMSPYNAAAAAAYHHPFYFNPSTGLYVDAAAASRHVTHMGPMSAGSQPHQHHQHPSFYTPNPTHHHHQQQQNHSTLEQLDDMMRKANLNNAAAHMARANNQSQQPPQQQQQQIVNTQYNGNYATNEQKLIWSVGNQAEMMSSNQATAISQQLVQQQQQLVQQQQQQQQQQQLQLSTSAPTAPTVLHPTTYYYLSQYPAPPTNYPMYNQTAPSAAATANSNIAAAAQYYYYATAASQLGFANPTTLPQQQQHHIIVNNPNSNTLYSNLHVNPTMMPQQQQQQYFSPTLPSPNQSQVQSQSVADQSQQQQQPQSTAPISVMITNGSANSTALLTPNSSHSSSSQHFATQINGPQHQQQSQPQTPSNLLTPESTPQPITSSSSSTLVNQLSPIQDLSVQPPQQTERVQEEPEITQEQQPIQQQPQPQPPMRQQHYQRTESLSKPGGYQQYYDNRSNRNNNSYQNKTGGAYKPRPGGYRHQQQQQQSNPIYRNGGSMKDN